MSTPPPPPPPPGQPYQNPQPGAGAAPPPGGIPGRPPTGGGYGAPVPQQHNPYAQTSPGFGMPQQQPGYYGAPPQGVPPQQPQQPQQPGAGPRGGPGRGLVWAVVGAAVASAAWAGGVFLIGAGSDSAKPDSHGYRVVKDLCKTADLSAFDTQYPEKDDDPSSYTSDRASMAQMYCSESPDTDDDDTSGYSYAYLTVNAQLHRMTDPKAEFGDNWRAYGDRGGDPEDDYKVTEVDGFGDEAYLLSRDTVDDGSSGSREVILAVRDGGLTFSLAWDAYTSSSADDDDSDSSTKLPSLDEATEWVKKSTTATMANLK